MDSWEEGFDTWTPQAGNPGDATAETGADLDREELLRLARDLAARREAEQAAAQTELAKLKQSLRERAEAVAARERELDRQQRQLEKGRPKRGEPSGSVDEEALAARERAALERAHALEARERAARELARELEAETARLAEREQELADALAAAQARLTETAAERELTAAERERLEERDRAVHEVEKQLAAARIELEHERQHVERRVQELEARGRRHEARAASAPDGGVENAGAERELALERLEAKLETRERELALLRQGIDADRNALLERERALRRREVAEVRESFTPPLAPPSFSEGLAAFARRRPRR